MIVKDYGEMTPEQRLAYDAGYLAAKAEAREALGKSIDMHCTVCGHKYDPNPAGREAITCEHGNYQGTVTFVG